MTAKKRHKNAKNKRDDGSPNFSGSHHHPADTPYETNESHAPTQPCKPERMKRKNFFEGWRYETTGSKLTIIINAILAISTIILAFHTYKLVSDSKQQTKQFIRQVEIADSTLALSNSTAKLELRAYLNVSGAIDTFHRDTIYVPFINSGKTPAFNIRHITFSFTSNYDRKNLDNIINAFILTKNGYAIDPKSNIEMQNITIIGSGGDIVIGIGQTATRQIIIPKDKLIKSFEILTDRKKRMYLYMRIEYEDIFSITHKTEICLIWKNGGWIFHNAYNSST